MKKKAAFILIYVLPLPLLLFSIMVGPSPDITFNDYGEWIMKLVKGIPIDADSKSALVQNIVQNVRLPRVLLTYLVGAGLATSGAGLQGIFRNRWLILMCWAFLQEPHLARLWRLPFHFFPSIFLLLFLVCSR